MSSGLTRVDMAVNSARSHVKKDKTPEEVLKEHLVFGCRFRGHRYRLDARRSGAGICHDCAAVLARLRCRHVPAGSEKKGGAS